MAVGEGGLVSTFSYAALGRETTLGSAVTATANCDFMSCSFKTSKESKILEELTLSRTYGNRISLGKKVEGEMEFYYYPEKDSLNWILQNAFGGTVTATELTAATSYTHAFDIGNLDEQTYKSLTFVVRKGDTLAGKYFEYKGVRVNELGITAEIDEALKMNASFVGMDVTTGADVSSGFTTTQVSPLEFVNGRFSVEDTITSLTSSSFWHVQKFDFKLSNNLKSDNESRRIGSDVLNILPQGIATMELNASIRFDTTTAYDAMLAGTKLAAEFEFLGPTLPGSAIRSGIKLTFPKVYIKNAGDPEIGGPDEILVSEIAFDVLRDNSSATGYAVQAVVTNATAAY
jgi:hypothetical protein